MASTGTVHLRLRTVFLHAASGGEYGRWIPYTRDVLAAQGSDELPPQRDDTIVPPETLAILGPDLYDILKENATTRGSHPDLQFMRGRTIILHDCS